MGMSRETYLKQREAFEDHCLNKNIDPKSLWGLSIWDGWIARQDEIDALKEASRMCLNAMTKRAHELEAEVTRLRELAEKITEQYKKEEKAIRVSYGLRGTIEELCAELDKVKS